MAAPAQQNQSDNSMGFLWIMVAVFAGILLVWYLYHAYIVAGFLYFKSFEIAIISIFTTSLNDLAQVIRDILANNTAGSVNFSQMVEISTKVGNYLRFPVAIILGGLAFVLYNSSAKNHHRTTYSMKKLLLQEKQNWPQIAPAAKLNLLEEDIDKGGWAMMMKPMTFAKKYKLLKEEVAPAKEGHLSKEQKIVVTVIRSKANAIFARQMGQPWRGVKKLNVHSRALFAIFAAKACGDREGANALLRQIAASSETGRLDFSGTDELLEKHVEDKLVKKVLDKHAFELTMMASMLELSRIDGVLASAEFLWLKPLDRPLWYMLNTVGRQTAPVEVAGPYAHWLAEKQIGRKLVMPMLEEATNALEKYLADVLYIPDEE